MVLCFKRKFLWPVFLLCGLWCILVVLKGNPFVIWPHPHLQSRVGISAMYYGQVRLVPILTVKHNDPKNPSKHKATHRKGNKEIGNDHAYPVSQMLWNYQEDSIEFLQPSNQYKSWSQSKRRERVASSHLSRAIPAPRVKVEIFTHWIQNAITDSKEEYKRHLLGAPIFPALLSITLTFYTVIFGAVFRYIEKNLFWNEYAKNFLVFHDENWSSFHHQKSSTCFCQQKNRTC